MAELDKQRSAQPSRNYRAERGSESDVAGAYNAVFLSVKKAGRRTSLITDPPNGRMPPRTPEAQALATADRAFALELLAPTETCKQGLAGCAGGKYAPVSSRRDAVPPRYLTNAINRNNGPEDRSMGERCMASALPGSARRLAAASAGSFGPGMISISYDQGQGQEIARRNIPWTGVRILSRRPALGATRMGTGKATLVVDVTNFSPKSDFQGRGKTCIW